MLHTSPQPVAHRSLVKKMGIKRIFIACLISIMGPLAGLIAPLALAAESSLMPEPRIVQYALPAQLTNLTGNVSIIAQQGHNNQASVVQSRSGSYQFANFSKIIQTGNNNRAELTQNNGNNLGLIVQLGNNHHLSASQQGNSVGAAINAYQVGFNSNLTISQSGSGLRDINVQQQNYSGTSRPVTIDTR